MTKSLYIVGSGSQARYVIENLKDSTKYTIKGIVDIEKESNVGKRINGVEIVGLLGNIEKIIEEGGEVIVAYGDNKVKQEISDLLNAKGFSFGNAVSPYAYLSDNVEIGEGVIINPNATILPNVKIGNNVIIHSGCTIEHDNLIGDYSNIAPGVSTGGRVSIGKRCYVYTGAILVPDVEVGDDVIIGAGSVVLSNLDSNVKVVGVPAKVVGGKGQ